MAKKTRTTADTLEWVSTRRGIFIQRAEHITFLGRPVSLPTLLLTLTPLISLWVLDNQHILPVNHHASGWPTVVLALLLEVCVAAMELVIRGFANWSFCILLLTSWGSVTANFASRLVRGGFPIHASGAILGLGLQSYLIEVLAVAVVLDLLHLSVFPLRTATFGGKPYFRLRDRLLNIWGAILFSISLATTIGPPKWPRGALNVSVLVLATMTSYLYSLIIIGLVLGVFR
jgi:hypothetical protein